MRTLWQLILTLALGCHAAANPFFAMDTSVRNLEEVAKVKELGYDGFAWKLGGKEIEKAKAKAAETGTKLFAFYSYTGVSLGKGGLTWNAALETEIAALKDTGAILWLPINSRDFERSSPEGDAGAVSGLQRLADLAAGHGVRIAIYPHVGTWTERVQDAVRVARQVNRPNLGVTFNLCHCLKLGDENNIPQLLADAAPYLFVVTINGADAGAAGGPWDRLIQPLDAGTYDVRIVLKKLKELKYGGPIGLQAFGVKLPGTENLSRSIAAWKRLSQSE